MDLQGSIDLYVEIIEYCIPLLFIVNVGQVLINMIISAGFGGKVKTTINMQVGIWLMLKKGI